MSLGEASNLSESKFPIHFGSGAESFTFGHGLASKMMMNDRAFIMGSGFQEKIISVADDILRGYDSIEDFHSFLDYHYKGKHKSESFIYSIRKGDHFTNSESYCNRASIGPFTISYSGSGAEILEKLLLNADPKSNANILSLTGSTLEWLIRQDFLDSNFQSNMFGGAYEIAVPDLSGFRRLPYLVLHIEAETELADDGGFDIVSYQMKRLIFCVPFEWGSLHIISILGDSSHPTFNAFPAFQQNIDASSISLPSRPEEILEKFSPIFELVLIRHQDFNYFISKGVVSYSFSNGEFIVKLDEEKAAKAMNGTW